MADSNVLVLYEAKKDCMGCGACRSICSRKAIRMFPDEEGFLYPLIDKQICIGCKQCLAVCPLKNMMQPACS